MEHEAKIFVAGHRGLVGSAIVRHLTRSGYSHLLLQSRADLDLMNQNAVQTFFQQNRPDYVILAAAKVGGILANNTYPAQFIHQNLAIQSNVIHSAYEVGTRRLLFLGSSCIYPKLAPQPMQEDHLLTGPLEPTNEAYAIAKIAGIKMCAAYNHQYGTQFFALMPTNLYGPNDNFDLANSHVLPALMRKFHEARKSSASEVVVWGTGRPRREFLHVDDLAAACVFVMNLEQETFKRLLSADSVPLLNVGTGVDVTIRELAELIREVVGFGGDLRFDTTKPDGTPRKLLDVSRLTALGWNAEIDLREGIDRTYHWYREQL